MEIDREPSWEEEMEGRDTTPFPLLFHGGLHVSETAPSEPRKQRQMPKGRHFCPSEIKKLNLQPGKTNESSDRANTKISSHLHGIWQYGGHYPRPMNTEAACTPGYNCKSMKYIYHSDPANIKETMEVMTVSSNSSTNIYVYGLGRVNLDAL